MSRQKAARVEYPLWTRCAACLLLTASLPCAIVAGALTGAVPWPATTVCALVSMSGMRVLTGYKRPSELLAFLSRYRR